MNIAPFESVEHLIGQLRVNARGEAEESGHPVEEHPSWIAAAEIERAMRIRASRKEQIMGLAWVALVLIGAVVIGFVFMAPIFAA